VPATRRPDGAELDGGTIWPSCPTRRDLGFFVLHPEHD
jgi:hypothetical protein